MKCARSPLEVKMKYWGWHRVHTYRQASAWLAWRNRLVVIVHIFLNVAADTQLLPVSPKCFQTPAVSCLHSCLFWVGFTWTFCEIPLEKNRSFSSHASTSYRCSQLMALGFCFSGSFWKAQPITAAHLFASWQEVKKKKKRLSSKAAAFAF